LCVITKIKWSNRFLCGPMGPKNRTCKVSVDGTDFMICELSPFNPQWFRHKHNGPGIRYKIAICLQTGWIVWINGNQSAGKWSDLKIFRHRLKQMLLPGEMVEADGTYNDPVCRHLKGNRCVSMQDRQARCTQVPSQTRDHQRFLQGLWLHEASLSPSIGETQRLLWRGGCHCAARLGVW